VLWSVSGSAQEEAQEDTIDSRFDASSKTSVIVPIVNNNPATKTGAGLVPLLFFKFDKDDRLSPPSMVGAAMLYTTNKSYVLAPFARFFWNEDKNRASVALGTANINYNFTYDYQGEDITLVYTENRKPVVLTYSRRIVGKLYLGILYFGTKTNYHFNQGTDEENDFTRAVFERLGISDNFVSSIGLNLSYDSRDYVYYPTRGMMFSVRPKFYTAWLGSDNEYVDTDYKFTYYLPLATRKLIAFSVAGGFATGDVPFDGYQIYGVRNNLRGYEAGKYRGKNMVAAQAEYRWRFHGRWGMVAFAGVGSVWGGSMGTKTFERNLLPSAGAGLRYMIAPEKKINIRLDFALGVDGNQGLYFGVGEAF